MVMRSPADPAGQPCRVLRDPGVLPPRFPDFSSHMQPPPGCGTTVGPCPNEFEGWWKVIEIGCLWPLARSFYVYKLGAVAPQSRYNVSHGQKLRACLVWASSSATRFSVVSLVLNSRKFMIMDRGGASAVGLGPRERWARCICRSVPSLINFSLRSRFSTKVIMELPSSPSRTL